MKKFNLLVLFLVSFFVFFSVASAHPCKEQAEFNEIYRKAPENRATLQLVATTNQMKDLTDNKNTVEIRIYYDQVDEYKTLYFYKKIVDKEDYTLLATMCTYNSEYYTNTYDPYFESTGTEEFCSSGPILHDLTCGTLSCNDVMPGKVMQVESNSIYDEIINHKDDVDKLKEITGYMGLVKFTNDYDYTLEGLAYSNDASKVLEKSKNKLTKNSNKIKIKCPDQISIPLVGGYSQKDTTFVDQQFNIIKSNYTAKVRKIATNLQPKKTEKYEKNPCNTVGVLKALRISRRVINIIKILVPLVLIILGSIELSKVIISGDQNQINKSIKNLIGKVIIGLFIFFIPTIITAFVNLIPKSKDSSSSFSNCTACFFGDDDFSSVTCDQKIDGEISMQEDAKNFYTTWKSVERECASNYWAYVNSQCANIPSSYQQQCKDAITLSSYALKCVCENDKVTGYTQEVAEAKCEELYPLSKRKQGFEVVIDNYNKCMKNASSSVNNVLVTTCRDELQEHYSNESVLEEFKKMTK